MTSPDLNEMYERWRNATPEERPGIEEQLFKAIQRDAGIIVYVLFGQPNPDLASDIASSAVGGLPTFREDCAFSTWVFAIAIAKNKVAKEIETRERERDRYDLNIDTRFDELGDPEDDWSGGFTTPMEETPLLVRELADGFSPAELVLFRGMCEGKNETELAEDLGITREAAETRGRRLRDKLLRKFIAP